MNEWRPNHYCMAELAIPKFTQPIPLDKAYGMLSKLIMTSNMKIPFKWQQIVNPQDGDVYIIYQPKEELANDSYLWTSNGFIQHIQIAPGNVMEVISKCFGFKEGQQLCTMSKLRYRIALPGNSIYLLQYLKIDSAKVQIPVLMPAPPSSVATTSTNPLPNAAPTIDQHISAVKKTMNAVPATNVLNSHAKPQSKSSINPINTGRPAEDADLDIDDDNHSWSILDIAKCRYKTNHEFMADIFCGNQKLDKIWSENSPADLEAKLKRLEGDLKYLEEAHDLKMKEIKESKEKFEMLYGGKLLHQYCT